MMIKITKTNHDHHYHDDNVICAEKDDHCDDNLCTMIPVLFSILTKGGDARTLSSVLTHSCEEI